MTPQQAQAQALIHEIDSVLHKASPRLPWVMSNEDAQQRQLLHQLRSYLVTSLQVSSPSPTLPDDPSRSVAAGELTRDSAPSASMGQLDTMQQTLHAMMQEMNHLRSTVLQPLQADVAGLQQQREFLRQEVQQLESQRQAAIASAAPTPQGAISQQVLQEVLQLLMQRLQESLSQQISQQINQSFQRLQATLQPSHDLPPGLSGTGLLPGMTTEQVQNLEALQSRADQVLTTIDTTLRVVFESMQRNLESYQDSLTRGLERMHGLGQQSEAQFAALLNHLAQRLGQEASTYLQASLQTQGLIAPEAPTARGTEPIAEAALPFAGSELGRANAEVSLASPQSRVARATPSVARSETLQLEDLDLSDFNLDALDTSLIDAEGADLEALPLEAGVPETWSLDLGTEALGTEALGAMQPSRADLPAETTAEAETMDFLNQLADTFDAPPLVREDDAQSLPATATSWTDGSTTAELRELYQSLFGSDEFAGTTPVTSPPQVATSTTVPPSAPTLDNLFGGLDATIHPDSFDLELLDTEPSQPDVRMTEQEAAPPTRLETETDLSTDWAALEGLGDRPSSLEDFFFPEASAASSPSVTPPPAATPPVNEELSFAAIADAEAEQAESIAWLTNASLERLSEEATVEPAPRTAAPDLPDLDTDPFNLSALAADLADEQETAASGTDLADLLADISATGTPPASLPAIETGAVSPSPEESFDAAAPDEDLLAAEDLQATASPDLLQIDDQTLQQLSEDLFSLESGELATTGQLPIAPPPSRMATPRPSPSPEPDRSTNRNASGQPEPTPDLATRTTEFSVEDFAADLFGELEVDALEADALGADVLGSAVPSSLTAPIAPTRTPLSTTENHAGELDTDPSLAVLEDLFTDPTPPDSTPAAPTPDPVPPPLSKGSDSGLLDDLFADFGELDVASKTAENNLASFQAEFPVWDDDPAKKKF